MPPNKCHQEDNGFPFESGFCQGISLVLSQGDFFLVTVTPSLLISDQNLCESTFPIKLLLSLSVFKGAMQIK